MADTTKQEELKKKLLDFFDKKITDLTTKFEADIDSIEKMKYEYFDTVIIKYREIEEEHKKQESEEKEKSEKEKENPEKKSDNPKHSKVEKKKIDPTNRPKTPAAATKRPKAKEEKPHDKTEIHKEKKETKAKPAVPKAGTTAKTAAKKDTGKKPATAKADPKAKTSTATKKGAANAKKVDSKKGGKKGAKKDKKEEEKKEEPQPEVEEKKPVVINPKYIYNIPEELKNNLGLSCIYFVLKGKYINDKKQILHLATNSPLLYKSFGSSMKFLLDDKKKEIQEKANEIEKFLNNYGDLNSYLSKEFTLGKKAINSIAFFKQKDEEEILKMAEIPKEVGMVLKCIYYIVDESFDENKTNKELFENLMNNILTKNEDKSFKSLFVNYCNQNKFLNLTKEKYDHINNIISENNNILNMIAMTKMSRPISLFCFFLKEVYDYINLKTLDNQFYYELRLKNNELQKYKDILYLIENDGKKREPPKEEKKEEQKVEENSQPKAEEAPKTTEEAPKTEEREKTEDQTKKEETQNAAEQPKTEEAPKEEAPATEGGEQPQA